MTSARNGAASVENLRREAEELSLRLTSAAALSPQTATDTSGHLTVTVDGAGRPTDVALSSSWRDDLEPEDLAAAVQSTAAMAEQLRLDAWTARLAELAPAAAEADQPAVSSGGRR